MCTFGPSWATGRVRPRVAMVTVTLGGLAVACSAPRDAVDRASFGYAASCGREYLDSAIHADSESGPFVRIFGYLNGGGAACPVQVAAFRRPAPGPFPVCDWRSAIDAHEPSGVVGSH